MENGSRLRNVHKMCLRTHKDNLWPFETGKLLVFFPTNAKKLLHFSFSLYQSLNPFRSNYNMSRNEFDIFIQIYDDNRKCIITQNNNKYLINLHIKFQIRTHARFTSFWSLSPKLPFKLIFVLHISLNITFIGWSKWKTCASHSKLICIKFTKHFPPFPFANISWTFCESNYAISAPARKHSHIRWIQYFITFFISFANWNPIPLIRAKVRMINKLK